MKLEQIKEKLSSIVKIMQWNLSVRSMDILPQLEEIERMLIELDKPTEVKIEPKQPIKETKEETKEINETPTKAELTEKYIAKYNKKPFAGWSVEVLQSKL